VDKGKELLIDYFSGTKADLNNKHKVWELREDQRKQK
jgi:hypothetical protein